MSDNYFKDESGSLTAKVESDGALLKITDKFQELLASKEEHFLFAWEDEAHEKSKYAHFLIINGEDPSKTLDIEISIPDHKCCVYFSIDYLIAHMDIETALKFNVEFNQYKKDSIGYHFNMFSEHCSLYLSKLVCVDNKQPDYAAAIGYDAYVSFVDNLDIVVQDFEKKIPDNIKAQMMKLD